MVPIVCSRGSFGSNERNSGDSSGGFGVHRLAISFGREGWQSHFAAAHLGNLGTQLLLPCFCEYLCHLLGFTGHSGVGRRIVVAVAVAGAGGAAAVLEAAIVIVWWMHYEVMMMV